MTKEKAIEELEQRLSTLKILGGSYVDCVNGEAIKVAIEALKQPEQKKGRWEQQTEPMGWYDVECAVCSVCKASFDLSEGYSIEDIRKLFAYCPSCGAEMEVNNEQALSNDEQENAADAD